MLLYSCLKSPSSAQDPLSKHYLMVSKNLMLDRTSSIASVKMHHRCMCDTCPAETGSLYLMQRYCSLYQNIVIGLYTDHIGGYAAMHRKIGHGEGRAKRR